MDNFARLPGGSTARVALLAATFALFFGARAHGHETDQYSVPIGREFADLRFFFSEEFYDTLQAAVEKTNTRIQGSLIQGVPTAETARLQSPDVIARAVLLEFPPVINYVESLEMRLRSAEVVRRFPGLVVAYMPTLWIYHHWSLLIDPTKLVRLWRCSTVMINGTYLGTDKIVHFAHMGYIYFSTYRQAIAAGTDEAEAMRRVLKVGAGTNLLSEGAFLGFLTTGVVSNGDLAADYSGLKFFQNLTERVRIAGEDRPPMLVRDGELWRLNEHVRRDRDFFSIFVSPHWDEVLNPNVYAFGMGPAMEAEVRKRCEDVRYWYRAADGGPLTKEDFESIASELTTYFGEDYGHQGNPEEMVTVSRVCFPPGEDSTAAASSRGASGRDTFVGLARHPLSAGTGQRDALGRTSLWRAARAGQRRQIEMSAGAGAIDAADIDGETPLHAACRGGHAEVVESLLRGGANARARAAYGQTPLHLAARAGDVRVVTALLSAGADADDKDSFGCTALHDAASRGYADVLSALLDGGGDADACDARGNTPLHRAARGGHADAVRRLLSAGADRIRTNASGHTAQDEARFSKNRQTIELLRQRNASALSRRR